VKPQKSKLAQVLSTSWFKTSARDGNAEVPGILLKSERTISSEKWKEINKYNTYKYIELYIFISAGMKFWKKIAVRYTGIYRTFRALSNIILRGLTRVTNLRGKKFRTTCLEFKPSLPLTLYFTQQQITDNGFV
jgi:hypothetical protein